MKLFIIIIASILFVNQVSCTDYPKLYPPQPFHLSGRVVVGVDARPGSAPYQVSLQTQDGSHDCGGAIIDKDWIVTAGHCVQGKKPNQIRILTGTQNLRISGKLYSACKIIIHSRFNKPTYNNDIALIKLSKSIVFNNSTQPIEYSYEQLPNDAVLNLTGWGRLSAWGSNPDTLKTINLKYIPYDECKRRHNNDPGIDIGHVCTLNIVGEGACRGDSGGPLTYKGKLVAIVNWGIPCALGYPDAHARISYYHDFIRTTINSN